VVMVGASTSEPEVCSGSLRPRRQAGAILAKDVRL
jgi:hypothetical protein